MIDEENLDDEDSELYVSNKKPRFSTPASSSSSRNQQDEEEEIPYHTVDYMHDVPLNLLVEIGHANMTIREILALKKGSVCEFTKVVGEPMDIIVGGRLMARGEVVVVNERYGVRISEVTRPEEDPETIGSAYK